MSDFKVNDSVNLEQRKGSSKWQIVIKDSQDGSWRRVSSRTTDKDMAIEFGYMKLVEWRVLADRGIPTTIARKLRYTRMTELA